MAPNPTVLREMVIVGRRGAVTAWRQALLNGRSALGLAAAFAVAVAMAVPSLAAADKGITQAAAQVQPNPAAKTAAPGGLAAQVGAEMRRVLGDAPPPEPVPPPEVQPPAEPRPTPDKALPKPEPKPLRAGELTPAEAGAVRTFYRNRNWKPLWVTDEGPRPQAVAVLEVLKGADRDGLDPAAYNVKAIAARLAGPPAEVERLLTFALVRYAADLRTGRVPAQAVEGDLYRSPPVLRVGEVLTATAAAADVPAYLETLAPARAAYRALRDALASHRAMAAAGGWPRIEDGPTLKIGMTDPRITVLRQRLRATGELTEGDDASTEFDAPVEAALKKFQRRHGLEEDGSVGRQTLLTLDVPVQRRIRQIVVNMERLRWVPEALGRRYIIVNTAAAEMQVVEGGEPVLEMRVIVGQPKRETPFLSASMTHMVFNPVWNVPHHLAVEDVLEKVRHDRAYFAKQGLRVYATREDRLAELDPDSVDWGRAGQHGFPYRLRQDPGPKNAMGRVKFLLPNREDIYLHDTPTRSIFQKASRAASSGCIRLEKPIELATYLLSDREGWTREKIEAAIEEGKTETIALRHPLPVYLVYRSAWVDGEGKVEFRSDIYNRDKRLSKILFGTP